MGQYILLLWDPISKNDNAKFDVEFNIILTL